MFIELVESNRKGKRSLGGTLFSVALHTGLISLAVAATANARTEKSKPEPDPGIVVYVPQRSIAPTTRPTPVRRPNRTAITIPEAGGPPIVAPIAVATGIPDITLVASMPLGPSGAAAGDADPATSSEGPASAGPYTNFQVDKEVRAFPSNRAPVYPDALRTRGIEGEVYVRFVVDVSGRVDMKSMEILRASSPAFVSAVRYSLERARFQPAEAAGHKVAQLVEQRFQFRLDPQQ